MKTAMTEAILEVWRVHDEISHWLIENLPEEAFEATTLLRNGQPSKGRSVAQVFAHMHNLRRLHIGREFLAGVPKFEYADCPERGILLAAFRASGAGIAKRLARLIETGEKKKDRGGMALLGLLIAHDSHHRALILLACKQSGVRIPEEARFDIWEHWLMPKLK